MSSLRQQLLEAIKKSEGQFAQILWESPLCIAVISIKDHDDHHYLEVNEQFEQITGWKRDEVIGRSPSDIGIFVDSGQRAQLVRRLLSGEAVRNDEIQFRRKNGEIRTVLESAELVEIEGEHCILSIDADITERKRFENSLLWRLNFERLVSDLSRTFIVLHENEIDANIEKGLGCIGEFLKMDRITLYEFAPDRTAMGTTYSWSGAGVKQTSHLVATDAVPWWWDRIVRGEATFMSQLNDLPADACLEKEFIRQRGVASAASIPLRAGGETNGVIIFVTVQRQVSWTEDLTNQLRIIGDIFWNALQRKHAMAALVKAQAIVRGSEERLRLAMESGKSVGWDRDVKSGRDSLFGDLPGIFGIPAEVYDGGVEDFHRYLHPEDRGRVVEAIDYAMHTHTPYAAEFRIRWPDGTVRWLSAKGKFFYTQDGEAERMLGMAVDITERKLTEVALYESEERLRLAAHAGKMYAFDWDVTTDVILRSEEVTRLPGLVGEPTNLTKQQLLARIHPEDRATFSSSIAELTPERPNTQISFRLLRPDGSVIWLERTGHAFFDEQGKMVRMIGMVADITERRRLEEPLRRSEGYLSQAERLAHSGSWAWDARTRETFWSREMFRILGYDPEKTKPSLSDFLARVHPEDRLRAEQRVREEASGLDVVADYRIILPDGTIRHIQAIGHPIKNESGEVVEVVGTTVDVTERKRAAEALAKSEERLRLAQQAARIGTFERNLRTGVSTWTPELEAMYGLSPGSFGGTHAAFEALVHPDDRAAVIESVAASMKTGQPTNGEWSVVWPDGSVHWIAGRWQVFRNEAGEPSRMMGVNIEVTERKLAEQALRESEQRFRLAAQSGRMYSFEWDLTTDAVVRSPERVKVLGATEPLRVSHQQFVDSIYADDRPKFIATIAGLTPENPNAEVIYRVRGSDSALIWLKSSGRAFFDPEGKMLRVIGMVADITDLKRAEEALSEMTQKLIEAQEQERSRLARELHDDINQQLALLGVNLEALKQDIPTSAGELRKQIAKVSKQVEEVGKDIQALSHRLHSPKLEYLGLSAAAASFCREFSDQQKVEVSFHPENIPKKLPQEISVCLFRVLQEALQNAAKYSGSRQFEVSLQGGSNQIELTVHDSGVGFNPEEAIKGRGLGLISMQERLKLVGGQLSIDSKLQHGTTIHARVPLNPRAKSVGTVG